MISVTVERTAPIAPQELIDRLWSGAEWRIAGPKSGGLAIEYDDGRHQAIQLCVNAGRCFRAMSIMRFRDNPSRISFFYSRPPEGVVQQTGVWEACPSDEGCCLTLQRTLRLARHRSEAEASFAAREAAHETYLREYLAGLLESVTKKALLV